uniref:Cytochrome P450 3A n=1 Tax=Paramormyrops kingsleyae TaxID=1676925 RepID=A0A3B3R129_9TELE
MHRVFKKLYLFSKNTYTMNLIPSFSAGTWTLLITFFILLILYGVWPYGFFRNLGIPGPRPLPFVGTFLSYIWGFHNFDVQCFNKYGSIWGIFDGRQPLLMITDPAMIKTVMVKECYTIFTNRREMVLAGPLADALSLVKDEKWKRIRSALSPLFTSGRLKEIFPIVERYADSFIANLKKRNLENPVGIKDIFGPYSMDVVTSTSFSVDVDSINNPKDPFLSNVKKMLKFSLFNPFFLIITLFPFTARFFEKLGVSFVSKSSLDYFYRTVRKIKDEHHIKQESQVDFLQLMVQSQILEEKANAQESSKPVKGLTDHEILSQSLVFIIGGYETTSSTLSVLAHNLATNPTAMKKLQEEIDSVFPNNSPVTYEALMQMEYLEMAMNESMRLWPPAPRIERTCKNAVAIQGVTIPTGTLVVVPTYVLHRDPKIWESPDTYKPERFSKENREDINPYTFLPFGMGPRNCIGMRFAQLITKMVVVKLLQNFSLETCKETQIPLQLNALFQPKTPITLKIVPRTPARNQE